MVSIMSRGGVKYLTGEEIESLSLQGLVTDNQAVPVALSPSTPILGAISAGIEQIEKHINRICIREWYNCAFFHSLVSQIKVEVVLEGNQAFLNSLAVQTVCSVWSQTVTTSYYCWAVLYNTLINKTSILLFVYQCQGVFSAYRHTPPSTALLHPSCACVVSLSPLFRRHDTVLIIMSVFINIVYYK